MMLKSKLVLAAAAVLAPTLTLAMTTADTTLFTAKLGTGSVVHKLFQPGDTKAPQPFYKSFCATQKPVSYNNAKGNATLLFDKKSNTLYFAYSYSGLSGSPIMMHFHIAPAGKGGPIVQTICGHPPPGSANLGFSSAAVVSAKCPVGTAGFITGKYHLQGNPKLNPSVTADQEVADLMAGKFYINVHTCLNEAGEIRGQVVQDQ